VKIDRRLALLAALAASLLGACASVPRGAGRTWPPPTIRRASSN
jgi:hypothetical protein